MSFMHFIYRDTEQFMMQNYLPNISKIFHKVYVFDKFDLGWIKKSDTDFRIGLKMK